MRAKKLKLSLIATLATLACTPGVFIPHQAEFGEPTAVASPHDEPGGRFDGARVSPGFGILYRNGYTSEEASQRDCGGFFGDEPEHIIELDYAMPLKLVLHSDDALVMRVDSAEGERQCWDDESITNANVSLSAEFDPGIYQVRVGSVQPQTSHAYRLVLSE